MHFVFFHRWGNSGLKWGQTLINFDFPCKYAELLCSEENANTSIRVHFNYREVSSITSDVFSCCTNHSLLAPTLDHFGARVPLECHHFKNTTATFHFSFTTLNLNTAKKKGKTLNVLIDF